MQENVAKESELDPRLGGKVFTDGEAANSWRVLAMIQIAAVRQAIATPLDPFISDQAPTPGCEQLWLISMVGRELANNLNTAVNGVADAGTALPPIGSAIGAGQIVTEHNQLRMQIDISGRYGTERLIVDTNSSPFEVSGYGVTARPLVPATHILVREGNEELQGFDANGLTIDAELSASISRIEQSSGKRVAHLTDYVTAAAGVAATLLVPPKARDVTIYQTGVGAVSAQWLMFWGAVATGIVAGVLPFIPAVRRTEQLSIPPNVSQLQTDIDPDDARAWVVVWSIYP